MLTQQMLNICELIIFLVWKSFSFSQTLLTNILSTRMFPLYEVPFIYSTHFVPPYYFPYLSVGELCLIFFIFHV